MTERDVPHDEPDHDHHHDLVALALGELTGRDRAVALDHLAGCRNCRDEVDALIGTADRLLQAAPEMEPPVGFETAVLGRLIAEQPYRHVARQTRLRVPAGIAAAVAAIAVGAVLLLAAVRPGETTTHDMARATMSTPAGYEVGAAWIHEGDPAWILVSVPDWTNWNDDDVSAGDYELRIDLDGGATASVGPITFNELDGSWGTTIAVDTRQIRGVSIVDGSGRIWCSATF